MNLLYDPEYHNTGQYHKDMGARDERERIIGVIKERIETHKGFVNGALDAGVEPSASIYAAISELNGLLRELRK